MENNNNNRPQNRRIWPMVAPLIVFVSGPVILTVTWVLDVFVLNSDAYRTSYERFYYLKGGLVIAVIVSFPASVVVFLRILTSSKP
jgi:hypothetical protein